MDNYIKNTNEDELRFIRYKVTPCDILVVI